MDESILDRIPRLERSVRFWRGTSLILAAIVVSVLATGFGFGAAHLRDTRAWDEALIRAHEEAKVQLQALEEAKNKQRE
jgi:hypothetical protein